MYMNTRANLDYWSTDNFCLRWSLRTGAITIGFFSVVWQSLMVMSGVMMLVKCPVNTTTTTTNTNTTTNMTFADDSLPLDIIMSGGTGEVILSAKELEEEEKKEVIVDSSKVVKCPFVVVDSANSANSANIDTLESNSSGININNDNNSTLGDSNSNGTLESEKMNETVLISCPWLPGPETEVLAVHSKEKLFLVAGIFIAYSGVYGILSFCVVVGSVTRSVTLLQGWVAFTGFHNIIILASLLVPLPFTTLSHLFLSIAYFIVSLYTWAVVKSYMHALTVELNKPLLPEGSITDYTVDGVDVTEIPVQV